METYRPITMKWMYAQEILSIESLLVIWAIFTVYHFLYLYKKENVSCRFMFSNSIYFLVNYLIEIWTMAEANLLEHSCWYGSLAGLFRKDNDFRYGLWSTGQCQWSSKTFSVETFFKRGFKFALHFLAAGRFLKNAETCFAAFQQRKKHELSTFSNNFVLYDGYGSFPDSRDSPTTSSFSGWL